MNFYLNSVTGDLSIVKNLDYEDATFYEIIIEAQDGPGLLSRAKILVTVLDVNDNAPEITITSLTESVPEESTVESYISTCMIGIPGKMDRSRFLSLEICHLI